MKCLPKATCLNHEAFALAPLNNTNSLGVNSLFSIKAKIIYKAQLIENK
jgi:hypothetical protein